MKAKNIVESVKKFVRGKFYILKGKLTEVVKGLKSSSRTKKKPTKAQLKLAQEERNRAILGIGLLLVVVSITYSTAVIFIGVNSIESRIALAPQVVFAVTILIKAFSKLYR